MNEDSPLVKQYATEFYQLADVLSAEGYIMHVSGHLYVVSPVPRQHHLDTLT